MEGSELLSSQLSLAYVTSSVMEWLKHQGWFPLMDKETANLNRLVAVVASFLVAVGIHFSFDTSAGVLTITGLTAGNIVHGLLAWVQQFAFQQGAFKLLVKPATKE